MTAIVTEAEVKAGARVLQDRIDPALPLEAWMPDAKACLTAAAAVRSQCPGDGGEALIAAQAEIADLRTRLAEAVDVLRQEPIQWASSDIHGEPHGCAICFGHRDYGGHAPDCRLAAVLATSTTTGGPDDGR